MKLLVATGLFPPEIGGPATYAKLLADRLPALGIGVEIAPFSSVRTWPKVIRHVFYTMQLIRRARHADLIFVQDTVSTGLPAMIASKILRKPLLLRVPGDYAWEQGRQRFGVKDSIDDFQSRTYGLRIALLRFLQRMVTRSARTVITPSRYFADIVQAWGIPKDRIRPIFNSIGDADAIVLPTHRVQHPSIVTVGRLVPWKGFDTLIRLLAELPSWHLVIVGDGPDLARLESIARESSVAHRVLFVGARPRAEVFGWYKAADVFVLNTGFESFSYQVAEAMTVGIPLIATNIGSLPELVENNSEGVLVAPDDTAALKAAIESIEKSPEAWKARVEAAERKAAAFAPEVMLKRFVAVCNSIV